MYAKIASCYDRLNHILSLNTDTRWRRLAAARAPLRSGARVLDLCTGTADLALALARRHGGTRIVGVDRSPEMLVLAHRKLVRAGLEGAIALVEADAHELPFPDCQFDLITVAFGLRPLADLAGALNEAVRVLAGAGSLMVLEFAPPPSGLWGSVYRFYLKRLVPLVGGFLSGHRGSYEFLARSICSFHPPGRMMEFMEQRGLTDLSGLALTGGIAVLYTGTKPPAPSRGGGSWEEKDLGREESQIDGGR